MSKPIDWEAQVRKCASVEDYRELFQEEIAQEQVRAGKLLGPRPRTANAVTIAELSQPLRPFLLAKNAEDSQYVTVARTFRYMPLESFLGASLPAIVYQAGKEFGESLVSSHLVESADGLLELLAQLKIGLMDAQNGSVSVYECISCAGLPVIGHTLCDYEAGIIAGAVGGLTQKKVVVKERRCWGNGYTACEFVVSM